MDEYSIAGDYARHIRALAIIESGENPLASGDGGRAIGILQQHPSFFVQWYKEPDVTDTWNTAHIKAAAAFFEHYVPQYGIDLTVQAYNQGAAAVFQNGVRAPQYLARFTTALGVNA